MVFICQSAASPGCTRSTWTQNDPFCAPPMDRTEGTVPVQNGSIGYARGLSPRIITLCDRLRRETREWSHRERVPDAAGLVRSPRGGTQVRSCPRTSQTQMSANADARFEAAGGCPNTLRRRAPLRSGWSWASVTRHNSGGCHRRRRVLGSKMSPSDEPTACDATVGKPLYSGILAGHGGGGCEIRTREGLHPTRFPSVRPRPLGESSAGELTRTCG